MLYGRSGCFDLFICSYSVCGEHELCRHYLTDRLSLHQQQQHHLSFENNLIIFSVLKLWMEFLSIHQCLQQALLYLCATFDTREILLQVTAYANVLKLWHWGIGKWVHMNLLCLCHIPSVSMTQDSFTPSSCH